MAHRNDTGLAAWMMNEASGRRKLVVEGDRSYGCTLSACNGLDLLGAIKKDFKPWSDKGGITARDIDAAEKLLNKVEGYIRVSIIDGSCWEKDTGVGMIGLHKRASARVL
jgi:hypothetical protein